MSDSDDPKQRNDGSGTFVNGPVHGGVHNRSVNIFLSSEKEVPDADPTLEEGEGGSDDDESNPGLYLFFSAVLVVSGLYMVAYCVADIPFEGMPTHPSPGQRFMYGALGIVWVVCSAACGFARLAQIFTLCAARTTELAATNAHHHQRLARTNAWTAIAAARLSCLSACAAKVLTATFGWSPLGITVNRRADATSIKATELAAKARSDVSG